MHHLKITFRALSYALDREQAGVRNEYVNLSRRRDDGGWREWRSLKPCTVAVADSGEWLADPWMTHVIQVRYHRLEPCCSHASRWFLISLKKGMCFFLLRTLKN